MVVGKLMKFARMLVLVLRGVLVLVIVLVLMVVALLKLVVVTVVLGHLLELIQMVMVLVMTIMMGGRCCGSHSLLLRLHGPHIRPSLCARTRIRCGMDEWINARICACI